MDHFTVISRISFTRFLLLCCMLLCFSYTLLIVKKNSLYKANFLYKAIQFTVKFIFHSGFKTKKLPIFSFDCFLMDKSLNKIILKCKIKIKYYQLNQIMKLIVWTFCYIMKNWMINFYIFFRRDSPVGFFICRSKSI